VQRVVVNEVWKHGGDWLLRMYFDGVRDDKLLRGFGLVLRHGVEHGGGVAFAHVLRRGLG
jgi:hypothetical protein